MTPRRTTTTTEGDLAVTVDEWDGSVKATVRHKGNLVTAPWRVRERDSKEGRIERFKEKALTAANWPTVQKEGGKEGRR